MEKLKLTDAERLILANQYEILGLLNKDDSFTRLAENLRDGHRWIYEEKLHLSPNLSDADTHLVLDILRIYEALQDSHAQLTDKSGIDEGDLIFPGFGGNEEPELRAFAGALSQNGNYHHIVGDHPRDAHSATREMYGQMIGKWRELGKPRPLNKDQIVAILAAKAFPA
ncbi:YfbU family protein [Variovorax atrisoli]|uniref:YfbU family protein n=1 Tax=Variovorax atrisoli TaxID=3394203 RepID=UPI000366E991|nr:YfbU family protein [Variovorax paradoxus]